MAASAWRSRHNRLANLEFTYLAQIITGWTVQGVVTRIWHTSGDASRNATVVGAHSIVAY
jgi:hypothetical protein